MTERKQQKALRLIDTGRVHRITDEVWRVDGDTHPHLVTILRRDQARPPGGSGQFTPPSSCWTPDGPCLGHDWRAPCSHVLAVGITRDRSAADADPFAGLAGVR